MRVVAAACAAFAFLFLVLAEFLLDPSQNKFKVAAIVQAVALAFAAWFIVLGDRNPLRYVAAVLLGGAAVVFVFALRDDLYLDIHGNWIVSIAMLLAGILVLLAMKGLDRIGAALWVAAGVAYLVATSLVERKPQADLRYIFYGADIALTLACAWWAVAPFLAGVRQDGLPETS